MQPVYRCVTCLLLADSVALHFQVIVTYTQWWPCIPAFRGV